MKKTSLLSLVYTRLHPQGRVALRAYRKEFILGFHFWSKKSTKLFVKRPNFGSKSCRCVTPQQNQEGAIGMRLRVKPEKKLESGAFSSCVNGPDPSTTFIATPINPQITIWDEFSFQTLIVWSAPPQNSHYGLSFPCFLQHGNIKLLIWTDWGLIEALVEVFDQSVCSERSKHALMPSFFSGFTLRRSLSKLL